MKLHFVITLVFVVLHSASVHADWVRLGAAVKCDEQKDTFTVLPTVVTSSEKKNIPALNGFSAIEIGKNQRYECTLGDTKIEMRINVSGPRFSGMGQGAGVIIIDNLTVGQNTIFNQATNFNWQVISERVLTEIYIAKLNGKHSVRLCYSNGWSWKFPYQDKQCETTVAGENG